VLQKFKISVVVMEENIKGEKEDKMSLLREEVT
jgi:hypothetical protein